ncbi:MAG TPA: glycosyltransferase family 39 protein [Anaerolineales bacterium]|nr:glycosyltransferase family 39 protein [Anaerolineales bacterium]
MNRIRTWKASLTWEQAVMAVLLLLGIVLRIRQYLTDRSLWVDEAMLALNILHRNFAGLLQQPMEYGQGAPIGYVFSVKAFTLLLGDSEYALRFFSLLAGCAALLLIARLAQQHLDKTGAVLAVALFACAPYLIRYTSEAKQYMGDVLVSLLFLLLFFRTIQKPAAARDFLLIGAAGTLLLWFSHPSVFVAAGVGLTLFANYWINKDRQRLLWTALCGIAWSISLAILYVVNLRHLAASEFLLNYWQSGFMPLPPDPAWFAKTWDLFLQDPLSLQALPLFVLAVFGAGVVLLFRRDWRLGAVTLSPLLLALVASALHKYSLLSRMLLFATPLFFLILAGGVDGLAALLKNKYLSHGLRLVMAAYLIWSPLSVSFPEFAEPKRREHIKPSMAYLREYSKPDDTIYVYYNAGPAFRFYAPKYGLALENTIIGTDHSADPQAYYAELDRLDNRKRVWLLFSHVYELDEFNEKDFILEYVDRLGRKVKEYRVPATSVYLYLYDLR